MADRLLMDLDDRSFAALAGAFRRTGRLGFWVQAVLAVLPVILGAAAFLFSDNVSAPGMRINFLGMLAIASLLVLAFTTFWFRRYVWIADRLDNFSAAGLQRTVWVGISASAAGICFSIVVMLAEVIYLLFRFLETPQGGVPVLQTTLDQASWVSAIDMLSLLALVMTIAAEIVALVLGLLLLSRVLVLDGAPE